MQRIHLLSIQQHKYYRPTAINAAGGSIGLHYFNVGTFANNAALTINGSPTDVFVFNLSDNIQTNEAWTLTGGVLPSNIIFNFANAGAAPAIQTSGGSRTYGTFLTTKGPSAQLSNFNNTGALIVIDNTANLQFVSGSNNFGDPFNPPGPPGPPGPAVPGPLPILGAAAAFRWSRIIRKRIKTAKNQISHATA